MTYETRMMQVAYEEKETEVENEKKCVIVGYALTFENESKNLGTQKDQVYEVIKRGALDTTDFSKCVCLFNHDANMIMGRIGINLKLSVDQVGLRFECEPTDTSYAEDVMQNLKAGVLSECSFDFRVEKDTIKYDKNRGVYIRTIEKIKDIRDVSVVTNPAYKDTAAVLLQRTHDLAQQETQAKIEAMQENEKNNDLSLQIRPKIAKLLEMRMLRHNEQRKKYMESDKT